MNKPTKRISYCWDANVLIAWLAEDQTAPLGDMELVVREIDSKTAILLMPVLAYSEVLEGKRTKKQMEEFKKFLRRSNVIVANTTEVIAEKAGQIRSRGLAAKPKRSIKTPDAIYLATAIIYGADVFHTLETSQMPLLSGTPIVDGLKICKPIPISGQGSAFNPESGSSS